VLLAECCYYESPKRLRSLLLTWVSDLHATFFFIDTQVPVVRSSLQTRVVSDCTLFWLALLHRFVHLLSKCYCVTLYLWGMTSEVLDHLNPRLGMKDVTTSKPSKQVGCTVGGVEWRPRQEKGVRSPLLLWVGCREGMKYSFWNGVCFGVLSVVLTLHLFFRVSRATLSCRQIQATQQMVTLLSGYRNLSYFCIRYDMTCYIYMHLKADISQRNLLHATKNKNIKIRKRKLNSRDWHQCQNCCLTKVWWTCPIQFTRWRRPLILTE